MSRVKESFKIICAFVFCTLLASCQTGDDGSSKGIVDSIGGYSADSAAIMEVLDLQLDAWNDGDLAGFVSYYSEDPGMRFITRNGMRSDKDSVLHGYQNSFPNREKMGKLDFEILEIDSLSAKLYGVRGKWKVKRKDAPSSSGMFSLIFKKESDWRILLDHTW